MGKLSKERSYGEDVSRAERCHSKEEGRFKSFRRSNAFSALMVILMMGIFLTAAGCSSETPDAEETADPVVSSESNADEKEPANEDPITEAQDPAENIPEDNEDATLGEKNAAKSARNYISIMAFSYSGLIKQLEFEGYSTEEATYGVEQTGADWNEQAAKKAKDYLSLTAFSYSGLVNQLEFEGYTNEEAVYGADQAGADWNEQAAKKAQDYLDLSSFSRSELKAQLEFEGFTSQEAEFGVTAVGY